MNLTESSLLAQRRGILATLPTTAAGTRHCPKYQSTAAKEWLAEREAELLPVGNFRLVFKRPGPIDRDPY